jgi:CYTH domain-containing protein
VSEKRLKYARIELERRFLLGGLPPGVDPASGYRQLEDLYFPGTSLRLRRVTAPSGEVVELKLNQKLEHEPRISSHRIITSFYLGPADYRHLAQLRGARLAKRRYVWPWQGVRFGVDVFEGGLAGLVLASAEVESEAILASLPALPIAHVEVTAEPLFAGGTLAVEEPTKILRRATELLAARAR